MIKKYDSIAKLAYLRKRKNQYLYLKKRIRERYILIIFIDIEKEKEFISKRYLRIGDCVVNSSLSKTDHFEILFYVIVKRSAVAS